MNPLRIMVDGRNLSLLTGTGVATYARNVCEVATSVGHHVDVLYGESFGYHRNPVFREISFFDLYRRKPASYVEALMSPMGVAKPFEVPLKGTVVARQFSANLPGANGFWNADGVFYKADIAYASPLRMSRSFNRVANVFGSDIAHWTYPLPLKLQDAANVYTVHDLVPLRLPFATLDRKRSYFRMVATICRDAERIITVSETSRNDILGLFDVEPEKVVNTYQSVNIPDRLLRIDRTALDTELLGTHEVSYKNYILFYGAIEPKKNIGRLIEAYLGSGLDIPLLVVGKDGWLFEKDKSLSRLFDPPADAGLRDDGSRRPEVRRLDYVSFPQLVSLIRGARAVALPSLYEGFGLPIIEGMICGTPVLTSDLGATAEIAGDAALLVDPYDVRAIRDGLVSLCTDDQRAGDLVEAGFRRSRYFAPERHAERLSAVYESVAGASAGRLTAYRG